MCHYFHKIRLYYLFYLSACIIGFLCFGETFNVKSFSVCIARFVIVSAMRNIILASMDCSMIGPMHCLHGTVAIWDMIGLHKVSVGSGTIS